MSDCSASASRLKIVVQSYITFYVIKCCHMQLMCRNNIAFFTILYMKAYCVLCNLTFAVCTLQACSGCRPCMCTTVYSTLTITSVEYKKFIYNKSTLYIHRCAKYNA